MDKKSIAWQGRAVETEAENVAAFLAELGVAAEQSVVEWNGEVFAPGEDLSAVPLSDGGSLSAFRVVAGG